MFLTATYLISPITHQFSNDDNNIQRSEMVQLVNKVKNRDLKTANIILDIDNKQVLKCRTSKDNGTIFDGSESFDEIYKYFYDQHRDTIDRVLKVTV
jgi:hypothetical protein